jgi:tetrahedral aminopeptidase
VDEELFKNLVTTPGISGREERIRGVVHREIEPLVDEVRIDRMGNIIAIRSGSGPRVMLCAHMDAIGFLVRHIDDEGFLRISRVGGFDPRVLVMQRALVQGKEDLIGIISPMEKPIHLLDEEDRKKSPKMENLFIDLLRPADEVKELVSVGDPVSLYREPMITDKVVVAPYLDNRLSLYVLLEALKRAKNTKIEIQAVVSVQEEVGVRGAITSAYDVNPDIGIALDVTIAGDVPGVDASDRVTSMGKGTGLGVMDSMAISDPRLVKHFRDMADAEDIDYQLDILLGGGTDAAAMQLARAGVPVITIGPPCRYVHTVNEAAHVDDIEASVRLVEEFLVNAHDLTLEW